MGTEILINSSLVTNDKNGYGETYEFVLDEDMHVVECVKINPYSQTIITQIENAAVTLDKLLFELNHVRVNPRVDNTDIIESLTAALEKIGVHVTNTPHQNDMATTFKPIGEITDNVRFYIGNNSIVVFLSPSTRPQLAAVGGRVVNSDHTSSDNTSNPSQTPPKKPTKR